MIYRNNGLFRLDTKDLTYCFHILKSGHAEHLYFGNRMLINKDNYLSLVEKKAGAPGNATMYAQDSPDLCLDDIKLEFSSYGKGDMREPFVCLRYADGSMTSDFLYKSDAMLEHFNPDGLPFATGNGTQEPETLKVSFLHKEYNVQMDIIYRVFYEANVITRCAIVTNLSEEKVYVERAYSLQLDLDGNDWRMTTFNGLWANEMQRNDHYVTSGMHVNESVAGVSSNRANPFVMISKKETSEDYGECMAFNLLYSGNHVESLSVSAYGKSRFLMGINDKFFSWELTPGDSFLTPEAVLTYSAGGFSGISRNMHFFVKEHIVRGEWKKKDRPVLLNSWEASYFKFTQRKLLKLAKAGSRCNMELFVLDDGWFGKRDNDTCSLGDWYVNKKKLPKGLLGLSKKINKLGMQFGIWVEPEMVNEDSECYRAHPEWVVKAPRNVHSVGRNQMILDLTNPEVQEDIIKKMTAVFSSAGISYVKWDMNRNFSDYYVSSLPPEKMGEMAHRYVLGLYRIMDVLTKTFPHILFEGCASGGNRFDLGILCYFPQIWASDNTDAVCRLKIQEGYSYGYPQSVIGAHVSGCPNHQTLRVTPLDTRFAVASFGLLGYECNLCEMTRKERKEIAEQIAFYKKHRHTLQFGDFYRLHSGNVVKWLAVSQDKNEAVGMMTQVQVIPGHTYEAFKTKGLLEDKEYRFTNVEKKHDIMQFGDLVNTVAPIHIKKNSLLHHLVAKVIKLPGEKEDATVSGAIMNNVGVRLHQGFSATGYSENVRLFQDYHSRLYILEAK